VLLDGDRILEVGPGLDGDVEIDCEGRLVTPGLFDCHVHFMVDGDFSAKTHLESPFSPAFFQAAKRGRGPRNERPACSWGVLLKQNPRMGPPPVPDSGSQGGTGRTQPPARICTLGLRCRPAPSSRGL